MLTANRNNFRSLENLVKIRSLLQSCSLLIICGLVGINKLHAQAAFATAPDKPISVNVYALLNTSVVYSNNNPTGDGKRGNELVAGAYGLCCGSFTGISGAADFGSGLGGIFQLETGFLLDRGIIEDQGQLNLSRSGGQIQPLCLPSVVTTSGTL